MRTKLRNLILYKLYPTILIISALFVALNLMHLNKSLPSKRAILNNSMDIKGSRSVQPNQQLKAAPSVQPNQHIHAVPSVQPNQQLKAAPSVQPNQHIDAAPSEQPYTHIKAAPSVQPYQQIKTSPSQHIMGTLSPQHDTQIMANTSLQSYQHVNPPHHQNNMANSGVQTYPEIKTSSSLQTPQHINAISSLQTFQHWKMAIRHPEVNIGSRNFFRNGKPIELYAQQSKPTRRYDVVDDWIFRETFNNLVDCPRLFAEKSRVPSSTLTSIASALQNELRVNLKMAKDSCDTFKQTSGYITSPLTEMEASFPIAFSILVYKDAEQFESLLRTIYRPQNVYCVHIDKKSPAEFRTNIETIVNCFDNVFITPRSINVVYALFSVLEPEIMCLKELWNHNIKWKYFINLTGHEVALRTNYEMVKILASFNGANNMEATEVDKGRCDKAGPAPHGLIPVKGAVHVILSRPFVDFVLHNQVAIDLLEWSKKVLVSDEIFFSTLNYNKVLEAPGSYKGENKTTIDKNPFLAKQTHWTTQHTCNGKSIHLVCIYVTDDLPMLVTSQRFFANKAHLDYHPEVVVCMRELIYNRTADEYNGHLDFDVSYYEQLDFVKNHF